jgi:hypothetical protein
VGYSVEKAKRIILSCKRKLFCSLQLRGCCEKLHCRVTLITLLSVRFAAALAGQKATLAAGEPSEAVHTKLGPDGLSSEQCSGAAVEVSAAAARCVDANQALMLAFDVIAAS